MPEYTIERYVFPKSLAAIKEGLKDDVNDMDGEILYRIPAGPKSPKEEGIKKPVLLQHGILCDSDPCVVNKPQIAIGIEFWNSIM